MKDLETMEIIQNERSAETTAGELMELDDEGKALAEQKRYTLDVPEIKNDPLR